MGSLAVGWTAVPFFRLRRMESWQRSVAADQEDAGTTDQLRSWTHVQTRRKEQDELPDRNEQDQLNFYFRGGKLTPGFKILF